jgi:hypothetical protein
MPRPWHSARPSRSRSSRATAARGDARYRRPAHRGAWQPAGLSLEWALSPAHVPPAGGRRGRNRRPAGRPPARGQRAHRRGRARLHSRPRRPRRDDALPDRAGADRCGLSGRDIARGLEANGTPYVARIKNNKVLDRMAAPHLRRPPGRPPANRACGFTR